MNHRPTPPPETLRRAVRDHYGAIARGEGADCCGTAAASPAPASASDCCAPAGSPAARGSDLPSASLGYSEGELASLPEGADLGLGCGNPGAVASLRPGETVVDLGSGAGIDCFLAAERVGGAGRVIGVDMTPDMIEKARANARRAGVANVEFRLGEIEHLPVADGTVDVILSNCVVNLSPDKERVYREAFRVLKPGGRVALSDIVARADIPGDLRSDLALQAGCISGAATTSEIEGWLAGAGFEAIAIRTRSGGPPPAAPERANHATDWVFSATVEARKPA